jgi:hypothetical protein
MGPMLVAPGATNEYLLNIETEGAQTAGGLNVSTLMGMLSTGGAQADQTQIMGDEITHTGAKNAVGHTVSFSFLWTAPLATTSVDLEAWGNAVNLDGNTTGDRANTSPEVLSVTVDLAGGLPIIDHYKCYQGKDVKNPLFVKTTAETSDQFPSETVNVTKVKFVCNPVDVNGAPMINPSAHLICYQIKSGNLEPRPAVQVSTQFQISRFEVKKGKLLCVPGSKTIMP